MASRNHCGGGRKRGCAGAARNRLIALTLRRTFPVQRDSESIRAARAEAESEAASAFPTVPPPGSGDFAIVLSRCRSLMAGRERSASELLRAGGEREDRDPRREKTAPSIEISLSLHPLFLLTMTALL